MMMSSGSSIHSLFGLFRQLLRAHRKCLPAEMRELGDQYVRNEFSTMLRRVPTPTDGQWKTFVHEWNNYLNMLSASVDLHGGGTPTTISPQNKSSTLESDRLVTGIDRSGNLSEDILENHLSSEQRARLIALQKEAVSFGRKKFGVSEVKHD